MTTEIRSTRALVPSDLRLANLLRVIHELRSAETLSRAELARRTGMAAPTVHRLVSDLEAARLVEVDTVPVSNGRLGRPPVVYRFRQGSAVVAGVDVGNETTRVALANVNGRIVGSRTLPTDDTRTGLVRSLGCAIQRLLGEVGLPLAGVGVGIASVVHPETGELRNPPQHPAWAGIVLADSLHEYLGCEVTVEQDDHLAALAEASSGGTAPGTESLLVLQIGKGIGVGLALDAHKVTGHIGRFGRIARWPVAHPGCGFLPGTTLGETLTTGGLVAQYLARGGSAAVIDGATLASAARRDDRRATVVLAWAAAEIAAVVDQLDALVAPEVTVFGGGLSSSFDLLEPLIRCRLPDTVDLRPSVLGDQAVVAGAVLSGATFFEDWLLHRLQRA